VALSPGTRFGAYEIAGEIGAGGMGVVYQATDTKLDREVAIKVLPESMAADAERLTRFDREAKTLASLNHPNIAQIYGIEESDGTTALILELVEGPTLADRIEQGPLPADEALGIAMQIAEALEAAHGNSVVHRDLKPANIKLRPDGTVKVLDFGIAKALEPDNLTSEPQSPIMTTPATQVGVILGTAAYMSPEQAKGKPIDQRTDIWAFGCLLYEMLTGQLAFGAEDVPTTLARVIANDTNLDSLPAAISPAVRRTIDLCLQKDPRKRLHAIGDVRLALEGAFDTVSSMIASEAGSRAPLWKRPLPAAAAALVAGAVVASLVVWLAMQPEPRPVDRFDHDLVSGILLRGTGRLAVAVSPDGRNFVYNSSVGLQLRNLSDLDARVMPGTEPPSASPTFSPDGQQLAYWEFDGQLARIPVNGGARVVIAEMASSPFALGWESDGTILVAGLDGISRVAASGGTLETLVSMPGVDSNGAQLLPDGETLLFSIGAPGEWDSAQIVAQSLVTSERTVLWEGGFSPRYLATGHLVYANGNELFALRFDVNTLEVSGGPVPLVQGVQRSLAAAGVAQYDVSDDGTLVYVGGSSVGLRRTLLWVDRDGREEELSVDPGGYVYPRISPDGTRVVLDNRGDDVQLWVWDLQAETRTRLTIGQGAGNYPIWTPDGQRIAYHATAGDIDWKAANDTGTPETVATNVALGDNSPVSPYFFSLAGDAVVFRSESNPETGDDIGIIAVEDGAEPEWLLATPYNERNAELSPDGRWMAYESDDSGRYEVYVRPFPDVEADRRQVSNLGGGRPLWSRDGRELFYLEPGSPDRLMSVEVDLSGDTFSFGARTPLMEWPYRGIVTPPGRPYDVSPDGRRFLAIREGAGDGDRPSIIIVQNWFEEVRRLAPLE